MAGGFDDAFSAIADVTKQAAALPDHREREVPELEVEAVSERAEVRVGVRDSQVAWLDCDPFWFEQASREDVEGVVRATVNRALEEFNRRSLEELSQQLPDLRELGAAFQVANSKLDRAWADTLAAAKVQP
ncbi:hypothetical protein [uncultured Tessaracoccus sp.]|uniref:hypothetical protein n=1 Tax=uncultured Tessaracoccus sp. TaxID=905023 RepID=UPI002628E59F|nr:hypothetical protein [uncultured Tessaracoccus sp.]